MQNETVIKNLFSAIVNVELYKHFYIKEIYKRKMFLNRKFFLF